MNLANYLGLNADCIIHQARNSATGRPQDATGSLSYRTYGPASVGAAPTFLASGTFSTLLDSANTDGLYGFTPSVGSGQAGNYFVRVQYVVGGVTQVELYTFTRGS